MTTHDQPHSALRGRTHADGADVPTPAAGDPWPTIVFAGTEVQTLGDATFLAESSARRHRATRSRSWEAEAGSIDRLRASASRIRYEVDVPGEERLVLDWDEGLVDVTVGRHGSAARVRLRVSGPDMMAAHRVFEDVSRLLPACSSGDDGMVEFRFWTEGQRGAVGTPRRLAVPHWSEAARNYPRATRQALMPVMSDLDATAAAGRLLLWHGPPGTGKTSALRALAATHAERLSVHMILDPEAFLGRGAALLSEMLEDFDPTDADTWRLLVLEDADELVSADAKQRSGQGVARLLNLADGLYGEAFKVLVLITTNEPITAFHPAIARPGRCGSLVSFRPFGPDDASEWLSTSGRRDAPVTSPMTLAQLYAISAGRPLRETARRVGFQPTPAGPLPAATHSEMLTPASHHRGGAVPVHSQR